MPVLEADEESRAFGAGYDREITEKVSDAELWGEVFDGSIVADHGDAELVHAGKRVNPGALAWGPC